MKTPMLRLFCPTCGELMRRILTGTRGRYECPRCEYVLRLRQIKNGKNGSTRWLPMWPKIRLRQRSPAYAAEVERRKVMVRLFEATGNSTDGHKADTEERPERMMDHPAKVCL